MGKLSGKRVAILTESGFEEVELTSPKKALEDAGAKVDIVSPQQEKVKAWDHDHWSIELPVDVHVEDADINDYDALMVPGGVINPDKMRINKHCVEFAQQFLESGKPVAAICHGPQLLIETGLIDGRNMTSYPSLRTDLENAGVIWEDKEVVVDNGLVTSRSPKDLEAFNKKMIEEIAEGIHPALHTLRLLHISRSCLYKPTKPPTGGFFITKIHAMTNTSLKLEASWDEVKEKLKENDITLTDDDLKYTPGNADALLDHLSQKTGKSKAEVKGYIESVSSNRGKAS